MKKHYLIAFVLLSVMAMSSGAQNINGSFTHGAWNRTYIIHLPTGYLQGDTVPLLIGLHGLGDNASNFMNGTGLNFTSNANQFIAVYPQAIDENGFGAAWNNGTIPATVDDMGFLSDLIDTVAASYGVDLDRVYFTGFSMGGIMCHRIACELSERVAAVASILGTIATSIQNTCNPCRPMPVMHVHGTDDQTVPYAGNAFLGLASVDNTLAQWTNYANCTGNATITSLPDNANDGFTVETHEWASCDGGAEVLLYKVFGGPHTWLSTGNDINASTEIWNFVSRFSQGPCTFTGVDGGQELAVKVEVYPNPFNDIFTIQWEGDQLEAIEIYDLKGELLREYSGMPQFRQVAGNFEMNTSNWESGLYLVKLRNENSVNVLKVLKP